VPRNARRVSNEPLQETLESLAGKLEEAERQNSELQAQLSESNIRLAKIFNAAIETGGAELLDTLQHAIGMD
jgi:chaperonin cofactor prefoldin